MERTLPVDLSFVLAKIHGMRSRMYERERLERLLACRNVLELMRTISPGTDFVSHRHFERALVAMHVADIELVARYLDSPYRQVLLDFLCRYQVENLKVILRAWGRKLTPEEVSRHLVELSGGLALPTEALLASRDLDAFLANIPSKEFAQAASLGAEHFARSRSTFFIEAGLDRAWMSQLLM
ncbi:MAG: V-type ATPase subunit, partial [Candidatus Eisenbacteria bacterium]|nr:V-type ATPase subunit [Candidatus Eisenbacteria bacterium]